MRAIKVAPEAEEDLEEIWSSIAEHNAEAASGIIQAITGKFPTLRDYPYMGW
jgi:plasmid stabilization system protein ParE